MRRRYMPRQRQFPPSFSSVVHTRTHVRNCFALSIPRRISFDFCITCDLACMKKILPRQLGKPTHSCLYCDGNTNRIMPPFFRDNVVRRERGKVFSDYQICTMSKKWEMLWRENRERYPLASMFEKSKVSSTWSSEHKSFSGMYSLPSVSLSQYVVDYLHLSMRLTKTLYDPIIHQVVFLLLFFATVFLLYQ